MLLGDNIIYKIEVENKGPDTATNVTVTDALPSSVNFVSASTGCFYNSTSGTVTCNIGNLANGQEVKGTIVVQTTAAGKVTNIANVTANEPDPDLSNNTDGTDTKVVVGVKSVSLSPSTIKGGNNVTGTVKLVAAAPQDTVITRSSSNASVAKPAVRSVTISAGQTARHLPLRPLRSAVRRQ